MKFCFNMLNIRSSTINLIISIFWSRGYVQNNMEIAVISIGYKVTGAAHTTVICCLHL